ncbi:MAG TPA: ribokinase [Thermosynergistes sp.]|nr:ribokinase [Thermosynergistes sp.]
MVKVVVVGSVNMDLIVRVSRLPRLGETMSGEGFSMGGGGKGANQAVACARLGARVTMAGCVGDDDFGKRLLSDLVSEDIDCTPVRVCPGINTGVALIAVTKEGENAIILSPGANALTSGEDVERAAVAMKEAQVALFQLEIPTATVMVGLKKAKEAGCLTVLDPAPAAPLPDEVWPLVDVAAPNEIEAADLGGSDEPTRAALRLLEKGAGCVVVSLGSKGALTVTRDCTFSVPAFPVEVVDTTGAGDAFRAGLAVALAEGKTLEEAVRFGTAAGALACTALGARSSLPQRSAVLQMLSSSSARYSTEKSQTSLKPK